MQDLADEASAIVVGKVTEVSVGEYTNVRISISEYITNNLNDTKTEIAIRSQTVCKADYGFGLVSDEQNLMKESMCFFFLRKMMEVDLFQAKLMHQGLSDYWKISGRSKTAVGIYRLL